MAMIHLEPQTLEMFSRALDGLKPPPNLSLSQWADNTESSLLRLRLHRGSGTRTLRRSSVRSWMLSEMFTSARWLP